MSKNRLKFTTKIIVSLCPQNNTTTYYSDTHTRGLGIYVTRTGVKTYFVYRKVEGRPQRIILGHTDEITLNQAREKANKIHLQILDGVNPQDKKHSLREEMTFGELWELYLERHAIPHLSNSRNQQTIYRMYLSKWSDKKISYITSNHIRELHQQIGRDVGLVRANHVHALIRSMYNRAIEWGWNKPNPAYGVKRFKERSRERFLSTQEMRCFLDALAKEPHEVVRDYLYMSLFTGARKGNVEAMRWQDIDLISAQWVIPMTKNGKPHIIPLVEPALEILKRRKAQTNSPWVFAVSRGKSGHLKNPWYIWSEVLKRAGITNLRIHDLRRTLGSWQAALGANSYVIGKSLGHTSPQSTAIYARLDLNPVRQSLSNAVQAMLKGR
jgi:integrase